MVVGEALVVAIEEEDGSDIDGGNIDNFPIVPLGFKEPEGSDSDGGNVDNFPAIPSGFSLTPCYKKCRNHPSLPIEFVSDDDKEEVEDDELSDDTMSEASSSSSNGEGNNIEQD